MPSTTSAAEHRDLAEVYLDNARAATFEEDHDAATLYVAKAQVHAILAMSAPERVTMRPLRTAPDA